MPSAAAVAQQQASAAPFKFEIDSLSFWYGAQQVLFDISLAIPAGQASVLIGRSGGGKSTFLRCLNRLAEATEGARHAGRIFLDGQDIHAHGLDVTALRRRVGLVAQKSTMLSGSILENVTWGLKLSGHKDGQELAGRAEAALRRGALWDEVADRLNAPAAELSGGQQQRLCIARALALEPEVLLFDEPLTGLDAQAAWQIEELLASLKRERTIVAVLHDLAVAERLADQVAVMHAGRLVESGGCEVFRRPREEVTRRLLSGADASPASPA